MQYGDTDRLIGDINRFARRVHVDRNKEVLVVDLQAVSGEEKNANAAAGNFLDEFVDGLIHLLLANVGIGLYFKAHLAQFGRD